ncbi:PIG-L family deacetylase [Aquirufa antheringensis]|uniref:PIG-L family deacetylase n=1 Tax=Aquirufa antheringensis TaxID=2516559 RepID=UPI0022A88375|nr:PIG-L family deacetylase [Aquirufa antheringensis]MCZ2486450.1 PIG-L family deacetylase [Aquirufa antheringensis]MCZ2488769.1 PIG-L family deacetylase [Aquirufa antheringensis]
MKRIILFALLSLPAFAQQRTSAQLGEDLQKLRVLGSVLHVAAHPDDESTHMLTWFAQQQHWETSYFACTRGDGGQNLIGDEQGVPLGLIRTQELLAARRIDGANQYFSRAFDFGFSKSTEEALVFWDRQLILSDLVWVIRKTRPDIIFTRFPPDARAGHGHHSASAALAIEAYKAAADPKMFPEQLKKGVDVWQAKRLLWNTFRFPGSTGNSTISDSQFKVNIGDYLPFLGQSTGELAAYSRSQHKSQGFGFAVDRGRSTEYFATLGGEAPKEFLWDGVDASWNRVNSNIDALITPIIKAYNPAKPYESISALINLKKSIQALPKSPWTEKKLNEINTWVVNAAGIYLGATTSQGIVAVGEKLPIKTEFIVRAPIQVEKVQISFAGMDSTIHGTLEPYKKYPFNRVITASAPITQPYWIQEAKATGHFNVSDQQKIGQAKVDPAYTAKAIFHIQGEEFSLEKPVQELIIDPVKGEILQPIAVTPKTVFRLSSNVVLLPKGSKTTKTIQLSITALAALKPGRMEVKSGASVLANISLKEGMKAGEKREWPVSFNEAVVPNGKITSNLQLHIYAGSENWIDSLDLQTIEYPHIPTQRYFTPVNLSLLHIDFAKKGNRLGYIKGAGDKVPEALKQMGYQVDFLGEKDLTAANLQKYDAVLTGVRAYNTNDYWENAYPEIMKYIENGGNYVVQYNTASFLGPMKSSMSPYPLLVSRNRITKEEAKPAFLLPSHALLNSPNKISETDFQDWIQERSVYTAETNDPHFEFPLGFTDPNEAENKGNIAVTKYGKGQFIYTGLVFFRELPAGVPGAYRLLANLLAKPSK